MYVLSDAVMWIGFIFLLLVAGWFISCYFVLRYSFKSSFNDDTNTLTEKPLGNALSAILIGLLLAYLVILRETQVMIIVVVIVAVILALYFIFETINYKVTFTNEYVEVTTFYRKVKHIKWEDVNRVYFSSIVNAVMIKYSNKGLTPVFINTYNFMYFLHELEKHIDERTFDKISSDIHNYLKLFMIDMYK